MKKINFKILFSVILTSCFASYSFAGKAPTLPNSYDGAPPTARSLALGGTGVALFGMTDSFFYNSAMYGYVGEGMQAEVSAAVMRRSDAAPKQVSIFDPSGEGLTTFVFIQNNSAIVWQALSDCTIDTSYSFGEGTSEININSFGLAVGQKNERGHSFGLNINYLYGKIAEVLNTGIQRGTNMASGNGFSIDLSFAMPLGKNAFFGASVKNLAGFMFWDDYNTEQLPIILKTGTGYQLKGFLFATDYERRFYRFGNLEENVLRFGMEQYINGRVCIRLGLVSDKDFDSDKFIYSYGFGVKIKSYELAAAAQQYKIDDKDFKKYLVSLSARIQ